MAGNTSPVAVLVATAWAFTYLGFALTMNLVHYGTYDSIAPEAFVTYRDTAAGPTLILVAALALPLVVWSAIFVFRPPKRVPRVATLAALAAALAPLVATAVYIVPVLQDELGRLGPTEATTGRMVLWDFVLRVVPAFLQAALFAGFLVAQLRERGPPAHEPAASQAGA